MNEKERDTYNNNILIYNNHIKVYRCQYKTFKELKQIEYLKKNLDTALLIFDFKENIKINSGPIEYDDTFRNKQPITILGFILYYFDKSSDLVKKKNFNILSTILNHDANFVKESLKLLKNELNLFKNLQIFVDAGPHFKNGELFDFLFFQNNNLNITINFFEEKHGKLPCDSHFSLLSKSLNEITNKIQISNIETLIKEYENYFNNFNKNNPNKIYDIKFLELKKIIYCIKKKVTEIKDLKIYNSFKKVNEKIQGSILSSNSNYIELNFIRKTVVDERKIKKSINNSKTTIEYGPNVKTKNIKQIEILQKQDLNLLKSNQKSIEDEILYITKQLEFLTINLKRKFDYENVDIYDIKFKSNMLANLRKTYIPS